MRYHFPISVDMFDFLTTGRFDYLEIGQTAEMILQMFPAPECVPKGLLVKKGWNIWLYGNIELHFSDDRLTQIRADFQPGEPLNGGRWLSLNPWFFNHADKLGLKWLESKVKVRWLSEHETMLRLTVVPIGYPSLKRICLKQMRLW